MFQMKLVPLLDGGEPLEFEATTSDVYVWERTHRGKTLQGLMQNLNLADMYAIAGVAARRAGLWNGNTDDLAASYTLTYQDTPAGVEDELRDLVDRLDHGEVSVDEFADAARALVAAEPDPTPPGHSPGDSSNSQSSRASRRASGRRKGNARS